MSKKQRRNHSSYKKIAHKRLNIRTIFQAVALEFYMAEKRKRTICSIYLPLTDLVTEKDMRDLLKQLPAPMILLGDFNAHNSLLGSKKMSTRKRMLEKILNRFNLNCLNKKEEIYYRVYD